MTSPEIYFKGRSVVITGAGKGIGRALAIKFHNLGSKVHALSRTLSDLQDLLIECPGIKIIQVDLTDWEEARKGVQSCGPIDVLLNVAGVGLEEPFLEITSKVFDQIININLRAVVITSQTAAKEMIKTGKGGSIINFSSRMAHRAFPDCSIYSTSKAAVDQLTKCMCLELGPHSIRVNSINLGGVWTPMWADTFKEGGEGRQDYEAFVQRVLQRIPAGKPFVPMDDVINTVIFLASDSASMMTGANIALDGGYTVT